MYLLHNGQRIKTEDFSFSLQNRSFLYGDGFFDTLRVENGKIPWLEFHFERWKNSCSAMGIPSPFGKSEWESLIFTILESDTARVRTHLWSGNGVQYGNRNDAEYLIQVFPWEKQVHVELRGGIFFEDRLTHNRFHWMKLNAAFFYSQMEKTALKMGWSEGILLNTSGELVEGCHSALFWKRQGQWFTHPNGADGIWSTAKAAALKLGNPEGERVIEGRLHHSEINLVTEWAMGNALQPWAPFSLWQDGNLGTRL